MKLTSAVGHQTKVSVNGVTENNILKLQTGTYADHPMPLVTSIFKDLAGEIILKTSVEGRKEMFHLTTLIGVGAVFSPVACLMGILSVVTTSGKLSCKEWCW